MVTPSILVQCILVIFLFALIRKLRLTTALIYLFVTSLFFADWAAANPVGYHIGFLLCLLPALLSLLAFLADIQNRSCKC